MRIDPGSRMVRQISAFSRESGRLQFLEAARCANFAKALSESAASGSSGLTSVGLAIGTPAYLGLGEYTDALTALERAVNQRDIALSATSIVNEPRWNPVRGQPRFTRVLERMNLGPYIAGQKR